MNKEQKSNPKFLIDSQSDFYEVNYHYLNDPDYKIESFDSSHIVLLRKILIQSEDPQTMAIDFNNDKSVDLKDLISLKRALIS